MKEIYKNDKGIDVGNGKKLYSINVNENLAKEIEIIKSQFINAEDKEKYFYCTKEQFRMFVDKCADVFINMITERFDGIIFVPSMLGTKGVKNDK